MSDPKDQWWVINGAELLHGLERAAAGEEPSLLYLEFYANTNADSTATGEAAICGECGEPMFFRCNTPTCQEET